MLPRPPGLRVSSLSARPAALRGLIIEPSRLAGGSVCFPLPLFYTKLESDLECIGFEESPGSP